MATENNRGKKYVASATGLNRDELHDMTAAVTKVKSMAKAKFDETLDLAVRLGLDTKKSEQTIRGTISMPSGTGKTVRVAVFAQGDNAKLARDAGADVVGADDLAADIEKGLVSREELERRAQATFPLALPAAAGRSNVTSDRANIVQSWLRAAMGKQNGCSKTISSSSPHHSTQRSAA